MYLFYSYPARILAGVVSVIAIMSLAMQTMANVERGVSLLAGWSAMLRFFTIWGVIASAVIFARIALRGRSEPHLPFALVTALVIIAGVYHLLLASAHHPEGLDWWTNIAHHTLVPAGGVLWWLLFSFDRLTGLRSLPIVILFPLIYGAFALINGAVTGFYPYFFLDQNTLGLTEVLVNMLWLAIVFMLVAAVLLGLRNVIRDHV